MNTLAIPWHYLVKGIGRMGRDAGWWATSAGVVKPNEIDPPHIILMPEHAFNAERFLEQVQTVYQRLGYVIVVAAEAIRDEQGQALGTIGQVGTDAFQHPLVSGAAQYLVELVKQHLQLRARFDKP